MEKCSKCKTDCETFASNLEISGHVHHFCKLCSSILESVQTGAIEDFLQDVDCYLIENKIDREIILARIRWSHKVKI